jgi:D-alanyl-D-alanine dipeptidase
MEFVGFLGAWNRRFTPVWGAVVLQAVALNWAVSAMAFAAEEQLVDIASSASGIVVEARYAQADNFVGTAIDGYEAPKALLAPQALAALEQAQQTLSEFGLGLKVFDGYRPQRAVDHFVRWAADLSATQMKDKYYPKVDKRNLFSDGYIAERSGHSRGSTVDLTLIDLASGAELAMGTAWDFFDPASWPSSQEPSAQERANRALLRAVMLAAGFRPLETEWWHFTLEDEPFPETYFDRPTR